MMCIGCGYVGASSEFVNPETGNLSYADAMNSGKAMYICPSCKTTESDPYSQKKFVKTAIDGRGIYTDAWKNRLNEAFKLLRAKNMTARQNVLCCQTCASYEIWTKLKEKKSANQEIPDGVAYYHGQDADGIKEGHGVYIAYGDTMELGGKRTCEEVGQIIVDTMKACGLEVFWNGNSNQRIRVLPEDKLSIVAKLRQSADAGLLQMDSRDETLYKQAKEFVTQFETTRIALESTKAALENAESPDSNETDLNTADTKLRSIGSEKNKVVNLRLAIQKSFSTA